MKTLPKLVLAAALLTAAVSAEAQYVSGYYRSTTTTYTYPSCSTYTPSYASSYTYANARYTAYTPSSATYTYSSTTYPSYGSSCYSYPSSYSVYGSSTQIGGTTFHNYSSSYGGNLSGTTATYGNTTYTSLYGSGW